jgi:hypothetical protein
MSVQERVEDLRKAAAKAEANRRAAEEAKRQSDWTLAQGRERIWRLKHAEELPYQILLQRARVLRLKNLGIIYMVENGSQVPFKQWTTYLEDRESVRDLPPQDLVKLIKRTRIKNLTEFIPPVANIQIPKPVLLPNLEWDNTVYINVDDNKLPFGLMTNRDPSPIHSWGLRYKEDNSLEVWGENIEYSDQIPRRKAHRVEKIESAIARAIVSPKVFQPLPESALYYSPTDTFRDSAPLLGLSRIDEDDKSTASAPISQKKLRWPTQRDLDRVRLGESLPRYESADGVGLTTEEFEGISHEYQDPLIPTGEGETEFN